MTSRLSLLTVCAICTGCLSAQVAQRARTAEEQAAILSARVRAVVELDQSSVPDAERLLAELGRVIESLSSAVAAADTVGMARAWDALADLERHIAALVDTARARARALQDLRERTEQVRATTADTAALADANAAQVATLTGLASTVGIPTPATVPPAQRARPEPPGRDYTPEAVTLLTALLTSGVGYGIGRRVLTGRREPPKSGQTGNGTAAPIPIAPQSALQTAFDVSHGGQP